MARLATGGDAGKQALAEVLAIQKFIRDTSYRAYKNHQRGLAAPPNDGSTLEELQRTVRTEVMQWGMDLAQFDLTAQGFVPLAQ